MARKLQQMKIALEESEERCSKEKKRRQELHNTLVELRGNIRVHCRVRPMLAIDSDESVDEAPLGEHQRDKKEELWLVAV